MRRRVLQAPTCRGVHKLRLSVPAHPSTEALPIPDGGNDAMQPRQGGCRISIGTLEVLESLLDALIYLESQAKDGHQSIGIVIVRSQFRVAASGRLASALKHGPAPRVWHQPRKQVRSAKLARKI